MSTQKLGKVARIDAKKRELFKKMKAGTGLPQVETVRSAAQPSDTHASASQYSPRPSDG